MSVTSNRDGYTIYFMGMCKIRKLEFCIAICKSSNKYGIEHNKPYKANPIISNAKQINALPLLTNDLDGGLTMYGVVGIVLDPKTSVESKIYIISYNLSILAWIIYPWIKETPSNSLDLKLFYRDPPTLVEYENHLFGVAWSFEGRKTFIQVYQFVSPSSSIGNASSSHPHFVTYGPPMPSKYFCSNFPQSAFSYEVPLHINVVAGIGNIWIGPPNSCLILFFNVKVKAWSNIPCIKLDQQNHHFQIGNCAFQPSIHAIV